MSVQKNIEQLLTDAFAPSYFSVENESNQHNVPAGSESHFKVVIATDQFLGKRSIQRHQAINGILMDIIQNQIHALALHTFTDQEWAEESTTPDSPLCLGGSKN